MRCWRPATSTSGEVVHEKERVAAAAEALRRPLHKFADEAITPYFSTDVGEMFHWEIEFPEVFLATLDPSARSFRDRLSVEHARHVETASAFLADIGRAEIEVDAAIFDLYEVSDSQRRMAEGSDAP